MLLSLIIADPRNKYEPFVYDNFGGGLDASMNFVSDEQLLKVFRLSNIPESEWETEREAYEARLNAAVDMQGKPINMLGVSPLSLVTL